MAVFGFVTTLVASLMLCSVIGAPMNYDTLNALAHPLDSISHALHPNQHAGHQPEYSGNDLDPLIDHRIGRHFDNQPWYPSAQDSGLWQYQSPEPWQQHHYLNSPGGGDAFDLANPPEHSREEIDEFVGLMNSPDDFLPPPPSVPHSQVVRFEPPYGAAASGNRLGVRGSSQAIGPSNEKGPADKEARQAALTTAFQETNLHRPGPLPGPFRPLSLTTLRFKSNGSSRPKANDDRVLDLKVQSYVETGLFQGQGNHEVLTAIKGVRNTQRTLLATDKERQVVKDIVRQREAWVSEYEWQPAHQDDADLHNGRFQEILKVKNALRGAVLSGRSYREGKPTAMMIINDHLVILKTAQSGNQRGRQEESAWYVAALPLIRDHDDEQLEYNTRFNGGDVYLLGTLWKKDEAPSIGAAPSHTWA